MPRQEVDEQEVVDVRLKDEVEKKVAILEKRLQDAGHGVVEGRETAYLEEEVMTEYKHLSISTTPYTKFTMLPGYKEVVVVIGGETKVRPNQI